MSAIDKLRSFAESRSADHEIIRDGLTYGDVREVLVAIERMKKNTRIAELERELAARHWIDEWLWGNSERRLAVEIDHRLRAYREDGSWVEAEDYPRLSLALGWKDDGHA